MLAWIGDHTVSKSSTMIETTSSANWVVYSTFNATGEASEYVHAQLRQYRALGFRILIVDTSPALSAARSDAWASLTDAWFTRANVGYDFASYRAGLEHLQHEFAVALNDLNLLLTNDSCLGPYFPLERVFASFDPVPAGSKTVFGISDSHEIAHHLQSYWLYFRPEVSPLVGEFLAQMPVAAHREEAIEHGEIGLSRYLSERGCRFHAYCTVADTVGTCSRSALPGGAAVELGLRRLFRKYRYSRNGDGACLKFLLKRPHPFSFVNLTHDFAVALHSRELSPFIKRSFFRSPQFQQQRANWSSVNVDGLTNGEASSVLLNQASLTGQRS